MTSFETIYDRFLGKITDDMYQEWTKEETIEDCRNILADAIPYFEFPRFAIYDYDDEGFAADLTNEEINILAILMMRAWVQRQITSIENTRMKYSGSIGSCLLEIINYNFRKNWNPEMGIRAEVII